MASCQLLKAVAETNCRGMTHSKRPPGSEADRSFCPNSSKAAAPAESVSWPCLNSTRLAAEGQCGKMAGIPQKASTTEPNSDIELMTEASGAVSLLALIAL